MLYIAYKYSNTPDKDALRKNLETIASVFEKNGLKTFILFRDKKDWGRKHHTNKWHSAFYMVLKLIFAEHVIIFIDNDVHSPGLNFELKYASFLNKPITLLVKEGIKAEEFRQAATHVVTFTNPSELKHLDTKLPKKLKLLLDFRV